MSFMDDIKIGFGFAKKNMLSFLLAMFGMLILIGIVIFIVISPLLVLVWLANPSDSAAFGLALASYFQGLSGFMGSNPLAGLFTGGAIGSYSSFRSLLSGLGCLVLSSEWQMRSF